MAYKKFLCIFVIFILFFSILGGQSITTVSVVTEEWEECTNADGTGLYFDILHAVFDPEKLKISFQIMPYTRAVDTVVSGKADIVVGAYADEIEGVIYPEWYFDSDNVSALYMKSKFPVFKGEEELDGRRVAWIRGYGYEEYFDRDMTVVELDKRETALSMLLKDRIDIFLDALMDIEASLETIPADRNKLAVLPIMYMELYMCFADTPKGKQLAAIWDKNFAELVSNGSLLKLYEKWDIADKYRF